MKIYDLLFALINCRNINQCFNWILLTRFIRLLLFQHSHKVARNNGYVLRYYLMAVSNQLSNKNAKFVLYLHQYISNVQSVPFRAIQFATNIEFTYTVCIFVVVTLNIWHVQWIQCTCARVSLMTDIKIGNPTYLVKLAFNKMINTTWTSHMSDSISILCYINGTECDFVFAVYIFRENWMCISFHFRFEYHLCFTNLSEQYTNEAFKKRIDDFGRFISSAFM